MAYCSSAEVTAEFKNIDFSSATALVTTAKVDDWILEADALINSFVGQRYTVPVTSGEGATLLKMYSRLLVSERVRKVLEVKKVAGGDSEQNPRGVILTTKDIMKALKDIAEGNVALIGAELLISGGGFYSSGKADGSEFIFKKDCDNW